MLSDETIQAVRDRVNIADVVGERVKLRRRGRNLLGLCPFHKEKTPSFNVNEERNFFHCFGCGASGDAIKFVQETEGLSFIEAIRELAQQLGIDIQETTSSTEQKRTEARRREREDLFAVNQAAAEFFERCLREHPLASCPLDELEQRGLSPTRDDDEIRTTLSAFRLGYAPYGWAGLVEELRKRALPIRAAEAVGLVAARKSGGGFYDRFRHRLMFAIIDLRGKVVGFSGRALPEPTPDLLTRAMIEPLGSTGEPPAKYMNSPESPIYHKRDVMFGLYQARQAIRQSDECIVVEGNFDVVSLHARGLQNVVAPLGTALTQEQAAQVKRYSPTLTLLFDGDAAGLRASRAAKEPCDAEALTVRVATLPHGTDPDALARSKGIEAVRSCLRGARGMLEYLIDTALEGGFSAADPQSQSRKLQEVLDLLAAESDPTTRALATARADVVAARLGIHDVSSLKALRRAIGRASQPTEPQRVTAAPERARSVVPQSAIEAEVVGAIVEYPELLDDPEVLLLLNHVQGRLALRVAALARHRQALTDRLEQFEPDFRTLVATRLAAPSLADAETALIALRENLKKLAAADRRRAKAELIERLRVASASGDTEQEAALLKEHAELATRGNHK